MRIAEVIGTVTLSRCHPSVTGYRWIIGVPFSSKALLAGTAPDGEALVIFDDLGAGNGQKIAFSEGGEAAVPFHAGKEAGRCVLCVHPGSSAFEEPQQL